MPCLLVVFTLVRGIDHAGFYNVITSYSAHWQLSESAYVIATHEPPEEMAKKFLPQLDFRDELHILTLVRPGWARTSYGTHKWLDQCL